MSRHLGVTDVTLRGEGRVNVIVHCTGTGSVRSGTELSAAALFPPARQVAGVRSPWESGVGHWPRGLLSMSHCLASSVPVVSLCRVLLQSIGSMRADGSPDGVVPLFSFCQQCSRSARLLSRQVEWCTARAEGAASRCDRVGSSRAALQRSRPAAWCLKRNRYTKHQIFRVGVSVSQERERERCFRGRCSLVRWLVSRVVYSRAVRVMDWYG